MSVIGSLRKLASLNKRAESTDPTVFTGDDLSEQQAETETPADQLAKALVDIDFKHVKPKPDNEAKDKPDDIGDTPAWGHDVPLTSSPDIIGTID